MPTLVWGVGIYTIYSLSTLVQGTFTGTLPVPAYMAYWFAPALFFAALIYRVLDRLPAWIAWAVALSGLLAGYVAGPSIASIPLHVGLALPSLVFVVIGRAARCYRSRLRLAFVLPAFAVAALFIASGFAHLLDIKSGSFGTVIGSVATATIFSLTLIVISEAVLPRLPGAVSAIATRLAVAGWAVILGHAAFIFLLRDLGLSPLIVFVGAVILPWAIGLAALATPLSPFVNGSPRQVTKAKSRATFGPQRV